jgi:hypothetical protein
MPEFATEKTPMDPSAPSSRAVVVWSVVLIVVFLSAGTLIVYQRERIARPIKQEQTQLRSIPQVSLEEVAKDFHKPARERRYKGKLVEVGGTVVRITKQTALAEQGKPAILVYLAPAAEHKALVCCACAIDRTSADVRRGDSVIVQGKVDIIPSEGPLQVGMIDARVIRRAVD